MSKLGHPAKRPLMRAAGLTLGMSIDRNEKTGVKKSSVYAPRSGLSPTPNASAAA
jgi:hypothetical protein